jgi:hypothetical protein
LVVGRWSLVVGRWSLVVGRWKEKTSTYCGVKEKFGYHGASDRVFSFGLKKAGFALPSLSSSAMIAAAVSPEKAT